MTVSRTAEVRWFAAGPVPAAVSDWFGALGPPVRPERRTDRYLAPTDDALGVKVRGERVEAKRRHAVLAVRHAGAAVEVWAKWSFPLAGGALPRDGWAEVDKVRRVRHADGPRGVCALELGAVTLGGVPWWTVGLEASGADPVAALAAGAARWLGAAPPLGAPQGYPAWLRAAAAPGAGSPARADRRPDLHQAADRPERAGEPGAAEQG